MKLNKYLLEVTVFLCGGIVMVYELVGSRVLGPYLGTSIFVWTSLIGIVLGSLSIGYYWGGRLADRRPDISILSLVIFLAGVFVWLTFLIKDNFLILLQNTITDVRLGSVVASVVLFTPASVALGMVSPYAAKLKLHKLKDSGSVMGNLYALSTIGSLTGTFLSGFYLIPYFGTNGLLIRLAISLMVLSVVLSLQKRLLLVKGLVAVILLSISVPTLLTGGRTLDLIADVDTSYSRIWIYDTDSRTKGLVRVFSINNEVNSGMYLKSDELVFDYTKYYHLARHFHPSFDSTLMLGGAGYSFPKDFLKTYDQATMDVVEIDPEITELARTYFKLSDDPRLSIFHEDARIFLNRNETRYDVIFGDAFTSHYSVPYQLTTQEATRRIYDSLYEDGVVILNMITAIEGEKGKFLRAEYRTYKSIFPQVYLFPVATMNPTEVQNVILVAIKSKERPTFASDEDFIDEMLRRRWIQEVEEDVPILTDDYAPVDYYISKII